jgi:uncharacterized protein (TIGR03118 family)
MRIPTRNLQHTVLEGKHKRQSRKRRPAVEGLEERALLSAAHDLAVHKHRAVPDDNTGNDYRAYALVSNAYVNAVKIDPRLVDPWDINFPQKSGTYPPIFVADQGTGVVTMYQIRGKGKTVTKSPLTVKIPTVGSSTPTGPTGVVYDPQNVFLIKGRHGQKVPATYIFATLQGTIEGYSTDSKAGKNSAEIVVANNNPSTTEYTGLAAGTFDGQHYIYAANDKASPGIDVYNTSFQPVTFHTPFDFFPQFTDPYLPKGFTPYGVHYLENNLIVTYRGPNLVGGAVAEFTSDGQFEKQFDCDTTTTGRLQSPWGAAVISEYSAANAAGFGQYAPDVLIGNYSSGQIDAYNFSSGEFVGKLKAGGTPLVIPGLRTIHFGPGLRISGQTPLKPHVALLFTEDPVDGNNASIYGEITPLTLL